eukprot:13589251-Alexandrium_andersonii.AAC.1
MSYGIVHDEVPPQHIGAQQTAWRLAMQPPLDEGPQPVIHQQAIVCLGPQLWPIGVTLHAQRLCSEHRLRVGKAVVPSPSAKQPPGLPERKVQTERPTTTPMAESVFACQLV